MTSFERFNVLLATKGIKAYKVSKDTGIPSSTFTEWKKGTYEPKKEKLQKIADYFGVPVTYFYEDKADQIMEQLTEHAVSVANTMDALRAAIILDEELKEHDFTSAELDQIMDYIRFIARK